MTTLPRTIGLFVFVIALTTFSALIHPYEVNASSCGLLSSAPANVTARSGSGSGQVTVSWNTVPNASSYAVVYGTQSNQYLYGGDPIGNAQTTWNTINALHPGTKYFFRLAAKHDGCVSPWSAEVAAVATGAMDTATTTAPIMVSEPVQQQTMAGATKDGPVGKPMFWAKNGPGVGQVSLYWKDADSANDYHVVYGAAGAGDQYGALHIGNVHWFTVSHLMAGKSYHFSLVPLFNGRTLPTTPSVTVMAMAPMQEPAMTTPTESMKPTNEPQAAVITPVEAQVMQQEPVVIQESTPAMDDNRVGGFAPPAVNQQQVTVTEEPQVTSDQQTVTVEDAPANQ